MKPIAAVEKMLRIKSNKEKAAHVHVHMARQRSRPRSPQTSAKPDSVVLVDVDVDVPRARDRLLQNAESPSNASFAPALSDRFLFGMLILSWHP
jgi:hypothetical protein